MLVIVTYDVSTADKKGATRLRRIAKECVNYGQRVQNSVFECLIDYGTFIKLKYKLLDIMDNDNDSIRFYLIGNNYQNKVESYGIKRDYSMDEPLIF